MKPICNLLFVASLFSVFVTNAQIRDTTVPHSTAERSMMRISLSSRYSAVADFQTGSGSLNQYVLNRLLLGGYISPTEVNNAEKRLNKNTRAGLFSYLAFDAAYVLQSYTKVNEKSKKHFVFHGLGIGQQNIAGAKFSSDLFKLAFQGNGRYAGKKLETGAVKLDQWNARTLYLSGQRLFVKDSVTSMLNLNVGISQLLTYRKLRVTESWVYTDPDVQYVDAYIHADLSNTGKSSLSGNGLGLVASAQYISQLFNAKSPVIINIDNVGIYRVWNGSTVGVKTSEAVRLNQTNISYAELRNGFGIDNQRDSLLADLSADTTAIPQWVTSPFRIALDFNFRALKINLDYTYISGYLPRVVFSPVSPFAFNALKQLSILPQLQLGGFDTYNVNLVLGYDKLKIISNGANQIKMYVKIYGIEGFVLPKREHGSGILFTASYSIFKRN